MKQRMAYLAPSLKTLGVLSLVMSLSARAQLIEVEDAPPAETVSVPSSLRSAERPIQTQPVGVSPGMAPATIGPARFAEGGLTAAGPTANATTNFTHQPVQVTNRRVQMPTAVNTPSDSNGSVVSAPTTGIGGSNPGNANTGGVQVQSVNVQAASDSNSESLSNSRAEFLRRERLRRELENESNVIATIEQGRLDDETERSRNLQGLRASVGGNSAAAASAAAASGNGAAAASAAATSSGYAPVTPVNGGTAAVAIAEADAVNGGYGSISTVSSYSESNLHLTPFVGRSFFENNDFVQVRPSNTVTVGANLDGQINSYFGLEGNFAYGRDSLNPGYPTYGGIVPVGVGGMSCPSGMTGVSYGGTFIPQANSRDSFSVGANLKLGTNVTEHLRPYGVAGLGAMLQKYNIDDAYTTAYANSIGWQRSTTHMLADFGAGLDFQVANSLAIGGRFDYLAILTRKWTAMQQIYGDGANRYRLTANVSLIF